MKIFQSQSNTESEKERDGEREYGLSCNANLCFPSLCGRLIVQKPSKRATQKTYSHLSLDGLRENYESADAMCTVFMLDRIDLKIINSSEPKEMAPNTTTRKDV